MNGKVLRQQAIAATITTPNMNMKTSTIERSDSVALFEAFGLGKMFAHKKLAISPRIVPRAVMPKPSQNPNVTPISSARNSCPNS